MTRKGINLLSMLKSIVQFFTENAALIADKPALLAALARVKVMISDIEALQDTQAIGTRPDTALKSETKVELIKANLVVLAGIGAHGAATNDTRLKMAADVTEYDLRRMRDNDLLLQSHSTRETALPIAPALLIWDVTQNDIDALDTTSSLYNAKSPEIRNIKARSKQATDDIKRKLDEANDFVKDTLDAMMLPFKKVNPTFYGNYLIASDVINLAGARRKGTTPDEVKPVV